MTTSLRAWFWGGLAVLLAGCGDSQSHVNGPDQPSRPDDAPVIVIARPNTHLEKPQEALAVAGEDPRMAVAATPPSPHSSDEELARMVRDPRRFASAPRVIALLVTELQALEALFVNTPANAMDRPRLIRRLAEGYVELKYAAIRDKQNLLRKPSPPPQEIAKLEKLAPAARTMAMKYYQIFIRDHSAFCMSPNAADPSLSQGCRDEAHYFMGLELLEADRSNEARKEFFALIKDFPRSKWLPHAYLAFGEMFFQEGKMDPTKLDFAQQAYEKVLQFPPPDNTTYGFTHYRLGQVHVQKQDNPRALSHLVKAAEFSMQYAVLPGSTLLGESVRREIVPVYALAGSPQKAEAFFQPIANDMPTSNERLVGMLDALVRVYLRDNKRMEAMAVCQSSASGSLVPACGGI